MEWERDGANWFGHSHGDGDEGVELSVCLNDDGTFGWVATFVTPFVSGPYPGTPDWNEREVGEGDEPTLLGAKWAALRCADRVRVMDDANNAAMEDQYDEAIRMAEAEGMEYR